MTLTLAQREKNGVTVALEWDKGGFYTVSVYQAIDESTARTTYERSYGTEKGAKAAYYRKRRECLR